MRFTIPFISVLLLLAPALASEPLQDVRLGGLRTGMTIAQVREVALAASPPVAILETSRPDGSPWVARLKIAEEETAAFLSSAAKGGRAYRVVSSRPLGHQTVSAVVAEWTGRFGMPTGTYYTNGKREAQVGWGLRPGPQGALEKVGTSHLRLLGEVSTTYEMISLTLLDDDEGD
jgi:hypothetical protein